MNIAELTEKMLNPNWVVQLVKWNPMFLCLEHDSKGKSRYGGGRQSFEMKWKSFYAKLSLFILGTVYMHDIWEFSSFSRIKPLRAVEMTKSSVESSTYIPQHVWSYLLSPSSSWRVALPHTVYHSFSGEGCFLQASEHSSSRNDIN